MYNKISVEKAMKVIFVIHIVIYMAWKFACKQHIV